MRIVFATSNPHKLKELKEIADSFGAEDIEFVLPPEGFDPDETGTTFEENSLIKAKEAHRLTGLPALADDSGLCVECLNGEPGIYSARYADTPQARIDKLLKAVEPFENRNAKFVCAMTLIGQDGDVIFADRGECHGTIAKTQAGNGGFGYDPVFLVKGKNGLTMAELSEEEKNEVSHRGNALRKVLEFLK
ncbi:RdgB/HAM1 family non-canonical purine NTP pyrophosphatase [bacterium]|nr:RdgB/HAM1 family non-canonical purine NTP pyrophosphatase [bacterium]